MIDTRYKIYLPWSLANEALWNISSPNPTEAPGHGEMCGQSGESFGQTCPGGESLRATEGSPWSWSEKAFLGFPTNGEFDTFNITRPGKLYHNYAFHGAVKPLVNCPIAMENQWKSPCYQWVNPCKSTMFCSEKRRWPPIETSQSRHHEFLVVLSLMSIFQLPSGKLT